MQTNFNFPLQHPSFLLRHSAHPRWWLRYAFSLTLFLHLYSLSLLLASPNRTSSLFSSPLTFPHPTSPLSKLIDFANPSFLIPTLPSSHLLSIAYSTTYSPSSQYSIHSTTSNGTSPIACILPTRRSFDSFILLTYNPTACSNANYVGF
jgi:hypothetical protein